MKTILTIGLLLFYLGISFSCTANVTTDAFTDSTIVSVPDTIVLPQAEGIEKKGMEKKIRKRIKENKKVIAAVLAFPLPFGFFGAHRIYLGTKPYMPFVYIGTLGGCALVLPFIDFFAIVFSNEESLKRYENNSKFFMWAK